MSLSVFKSSCVFTNSNNEVGSEHVMHVTVHYLFRDVYLHRITSVTKYKGSVFLAVFANIAHTSTVLITVVRLWRNNDLLDFSESPPPSNAIRI